MSSMDNGSSLKVVLRVFRRRKALFFSAVLLFILLACAYWLFMPRRYTALSVVQMQKSGSGGLNLDSLGGGGGGGPADALSANIDIQTQSSILQSETLALRVFHDLHLEKNADYRKYFQPLNHSPEENKSAILDIEDHPLLREKVVKTMRKNLHVSSVAGTRLIEVRFDNPDPQLAAAVVNRYVQDLTEYTFEVQFTATNQVSSWLEGQLTQLRQQSEALQSNLVALQRRTGLFGTTDSQGRVTVFSPVLQQLEQATSELSRAEANRILKESVYRTVEGGNADLISQLSGTMGDSGSGVQSSLQLIQDLRSQEAKLQAQIADDSTRFGSAYPRLIEHKASLAKVQQELAGEVQRVADRAHNDSLVAIRVESQARAAYETSRAAAVKQNDMTIEYSILQKEADQSAELYRDLLKKLREAGILEGLHSHNLTVVDPARTPAKASTPSLPLALALALLLGPLLSAGIVLLWDDVDDSIQNPSEIEALGVPLFGIAPRLTEKELKTKVVAIEQPLSAYSEALRSIRSATLLSSAHTLQVLGVTSAMPGEGKSTTTLNLAAVFAQTGKRCLLIEADMRKPILANRLGVRSSGLSRLLSDAQMPVEFSTFPELPTLSLLLAGPVPPLASELLGSDRFRELLGEWRKHFDYILIDLPPVLPVTDAQTVAPLVDAFLLVVRARTASRASLQRALKLLGPLLKQSSLGIVLNAVDPKSSAHSEYYGYKQAGYYGTGDAA